MERSFQDVDRSSCRAKTCLQSCQVSRWLAAACLSLATMVPTTAWSRQGELPRSWTGDLARTASLDAEPVPAMELPEVDAPKLLAADAEVKGVVPLQYAVPVEVSVTPASHGAWSELGDGARLWRYRFDAPGATDLNFGFTRYRLPPGATLHVYSESERYFEGPYTDRDNKSHGQLWVPVVPGDAAVVEVYVPADARFEPELKLTRVGTGYRDLLGRLGAPKLARGPQGDCNIDVVCPEGDPWRDQIRSVATYSYGGSRVCTGTLVMDTPMTFRPFFLTANHCGVDAGNAPSMVIFWNFESPSCGDLGGGSLADNQTGATFRAARFDVDFALVELDETPDPAFDVFYSGWDRSGTIPNGSVGIHHPRTAEKAISFNDDPLTTGASCIGTGGTNSHWFVDDWELGTTEPGSSGSGLFDPDSQKLIGFLSGGIASCTVIDFDCYGRFSVAWDGATSATRLRDWLDPNATGVTMVDGSDPNSPPLAMCADVLVSADASCQANANVDDGSSDPDGDPITLSQNPPGPYPLGVTDVTLSVTDALGATDTCTATVTVIDDTPPNVSCNAPSTITPADAPVSFAATAADNCGVSNLEIVGFDCFKFTKMGKRIDKTGSCEVSISNNVFTVEDSGGVDDQITWTAVATDGSGNQTTVSCGVLVENPGRGRSAP